MNQAFLSLVSLYLGFGEFASVTICICCQFCVSFGISIFFQQRFANLEKRWRQLTVHGVAVCLQRLLCHLFHVLVETDLVIEAWETLGFTVVLPIDTGGRFSGQQFASISSIIVDSTTWRKLPSDVVTLDF